MKEYNGTGKNAVHSENGDGKMDIIKIFLADQNQMVREGLSCLLGQESGFSVAGEAGTLEEVLSEVKRLQPDVVLLEATLPKLEDFEVIRKIHSSAGSIHVIVISWGLKQHEVRQALQSGATGFILKTSSFSELVGAIRGACKGEYYLSPEIKTDIIDSFLKQSDEGAVQDRYNMLTRREKEVFRVIVAGHTINEVAEILNISPKTVAKHRASLMEKLEIYNVASLVRYAMKIGVVPG
jgi:DNA-binding NarL/FixJ family response regulator